MAKKKRTVEELSQDPAAQEMLIRAEEMGIGTAFTRADDMAPCNIGGSGKTVTLQDDLEIKSGATLTILSGTTFDFNGYDITVNNGGTLALHLNLDVPSGSTVTFNSGSKLDLNTYMLAENTGTITWNGKPEWQKVILWTGTALE